MIEKSGLSLLIVDVRQLRCFIAVAEELHFGRAAHRLHVAQPAVSQTVKGLERELGISLLDRSNRRVTLTEAGSVLLVEAYAVVNRVEGATTVMSRLRDADNLRLTIGAVPALPPQLLPTLLARVRDELPDLTVSMRTLPAEARLPAVLDPAGGVSIALLRNASRTPGIATRLLAREAVGLALPAAHQLNTLAAVSPAELSGLPVVTFSAEADPEMHRKLFGALTEAGFTGPGALYESASGAVDASLRLVANGTAVSFKLASEVEAFGDPTIVWRPIAGLSITVSAYAAWRREPAREALSRVLPLLPRPRSCPSP